MLRMIDALKRTYWKSREEYENWRAHHHPTSIRRRAALRVRAWRFPVVEQHGIKLYRGSGLSTPVLEALEGDDYESPEARIVRHAVQPNDVVLELGTGLGLIALLCAKIVGNNDVHTYEANPALEPIIRQNFELNSLAPQLEVSLLGGAPGTITFYLMKNFWSSSTIKRHPRAKPIKVPVKCSNEEAKRIRPTFLVIDIEGGERDFIHYAQLDSVQKVCIELHPRVIGDEAVEQVKAFFVGLGFREDPMLSDAEHKLYLRPPAAIHGPLYGKPT